MKDILDGLKAQLKQGGMYIKLIYINVAVFILMGIIHQLMILMQSENQFNQVTQFLYLNTAWDQFFLRPWTWFTSIFLHYNFGHLFSNMLLLFMIGGILEHFLGAKKVLSIYVLGGLAGGFLQVVAKHTFPLFSGKMDYSILGASGAIIAIAVAAATYRPNFTVKLFGALEVKLIWIVGALVLLDLMSMGEMGGVARFAHIGGALFGYIAARLLLGGKDITKWFDRWMVKLQNLLKRKPRSKMSVEYSKSRGEKPPRNDYDYNESKAEKQAKVDAILDKIKYKGYDGLSKAEKDYLSRQ
ncbi:MAG: membrane associated rhomboid family serine protease [Parvicella sp.]|jgi:membrane associated rhomboid family serine protease